ncbi:MAG: NUDIX domain-containing protein, partial [Patescibacteria group bacterium]
EQYLVYKRLKQPFYGCQGFMSGKMKYGETVIETATREFHEECNLEGKPFLMAIRHYHVFNDETKELVEDKFLFFCGVENPTGKIKASNEGTYEWVNEEDFKEVVTNHFESFDRFLEDVDLLKKYDGKIEFEELDQFTDKF